MHINESLNHHSICWNKNEVTAALNFLEPDYPVILEYLSELLNSYNKWNKSNDYYNILCGEWLLHFTHIVYAAYLEVIRGNGIVSDEVIIDVCSDFRVVATENAFFNNQLRAHIFKLLNNRESIRYDFRAGTCTVGSKSKMSHQLKQIFSHAAFGKKNVPFVICRPVLKCNRQDWFKTLRKWRGWARQDDFSYPVSFESEVNVDWRRRKSADIIINNFVDVVCCLLPIYLPVILLEGLSMFRSKAHALELFRPQTLYTANSLHTHSLFKTLFADWREEGTKLLNHQHGGAYGIDNFVLNEYYETSVADRFYTLGWSDDLSKQVPLAGAISKSKQLVTHKNNRVLLTYVDYSNQVYRIQFNPMPGTIETMISETVTFVDNIKPCQNFVVRPYKLDYGWGILDSLQQINPLLNLDDINVPSVKSYSQSTLVVHNYLGTSWLETLAMNIPTVCFYDINTYAFRSKSQGFINELAEVGILHQSGIEAARFVLDVMDDPQVWWQKSDVQEARQAFVRNYANYSEDWARHWESEFQQWVN